VGVGDGGSRTKGRVLITEGSDRRNSFRGAAKKHTDGRGGSLRNKNTGGMTGGTVVGDQPTGGPRNSVKEGKGEIQSKGEESPPKSNNQIENQRG